MKNRKVQFKIKQLEEKLRKASNEYYNLDNSSMKDHEFDELKDELEKLDPNNSFLSEVGALVGVTEWNKAEHKISMTSLNKVNTKEEFIKWSEKINDNKYVVMEKLDGISIDLEYKNGELIDGITRGDGIIGESILPNIMKMKNVKRKIDNFSGSLRGEVVLFFDDFKEINNFLKKKNEILLKNPRNSSSGIAKRYDGKFSEFLTILFYDIECEILFNNEIEKLEYISNNLNLKTCFYKKDNINGIIKVYNDYVRVKRSECLYEIDGLVISSNNLKTQKDSGMISGRPKAKIAWKFPPMTKITKLIDVKWSIQNRRITPIAILEPVMLGVEVKKANLHNVDNFKKLNLYKNCKVLIKRSGDVIPHLIKKIDS